MSADIEQINKITQDYKDAVNTGDAESFLETLSDDVVFMSFDEPLVEGKRAIGKWLEEMFSAFNMKIDFSYSEIEVANSWAWSRGPFTYTLVPKRGGESVEVIGKFVDIFRKQADGSWRFARIITNSDKPTRVPQ
jgi:uncharacterized protein (TIGR02246 family)